MAVLGYLSKLTRGLGLAFGANFPYDFFYENFPYLMDNEQSFNVIPFFSQDIKQNTLLSSYLDS